MDHSVGLRLEPSRALKEKRLTTLLAGRPSGEQALQPVVRDAQLLGSLELSGFGFTWEEVRAAPAAHAEILALRRAQQLVPAQAPFSLQALLGWHAALSPDGSGYRTQERAREGGPAPAPPALVEGRLRLLEEWLGMESVRELRAAAAGALVLARIVEILPFDHGNGRVSRLAASHVMVRAGERPPILVKGDRPRLEAALQAAFRLDTEPLSHLLEEASARSLDVMIRALEAPGGV
jgi:Fic family protein